MKTTPWFNAVTQNPVRVGVYEVDVGGTYKRWSYWDGRKWCYSNILKKNAVSTYSRSNWMYSIGSKWRGLTASSWLQERKK